MSGSGGQALRGLVATLALASALWPVVAAADQHDPRLPGLFEELRTAPDATTAFAVEQEIWHAWLQYDDAEVDRAMRAGIAALSGGRLDEAVDRFAHATKLAPQFAEAWNKLATAHYFRGDLTQSVEEIRATLALEPRHFGALSGMAMILRDTGDETGALRAYERVLTIDPYAAGVREEVRRLRERLGERAL